MSGDVSALLVYSGLTRSWVFPFGGDLLMYVDLGNGAQTRFLTTASSHPQRFVVGTGCLDVALTLYKGEEALFGWSGTVTVPQSGVLALYVRPAHGRVLTKKHPQFEVEQRWRR